MVNLWSYEKEGIQELNNLQLKNKFVYKRIIIKDHIKNWSLETPSKTTWK